jgi:hypothetical protein
LPNSMTIRQMLAIFCENVVNVLPIFVTPWHVWQISRTDSNCISIFLQMLVKFGRMFATFVKIPLNNVFEHYYLYSWFRAQTESRALRTQLSSKKSEKTVCRDLHEIDSDTRCPQFPSA